MLGKFFVVTINYKDGQKTPSIERALSEYDWLRFSANSYYVYSYDLNAKSIYDKIRPAINPKDDILVAEIIISNRQGWASKLAVDWLNKPRA